MDERDLDAAKDAATDLLGSAYAQDLITMEQLEMRLTAVTAAGSADAIKEVVDDLAAKVVAARPAAVGGGLPEAQQVLSGSMSSVRREGHWLRSRRIIVAHKASSIRLDLAELADYPGQVFELELALKGCSCRIRVPRGTHVEERLDHHASNFRCSRSLQRSQVPGAATLVISGSIAGCNVRVSPSHSRRV